VLVEWALHHLDERFILEGFAKSFGVKWLGCSDLLPSALLSLDNFVDTLLVVLICVEILSVKSLELFDEHDVSHLLVRRVDS